MHVAAFAFEQSGPLVARDAVSALSACVAVASGAGVDVVERFFTQIAPPAGVFAGALPRRGSGEVRAEDVGPRARARAPADAVREFNTWLAAMRFRFGRDVALVAAGQRDVAWLVYLYAAHLARVAPRCVDAESDRERTRLLGDDDASVDISVPRHVETVALAYASHLAARIYCATPASSEQAERRARPGASVAGALASSPRIARAQSERQIDGAPAGAPAGAGKRQSSVAGARSALRSSGPLTARAASRTPSRGPAAALAGLVSPRARAHSKPPAPSGGADAQPAWELGGKHEGTPREGAHAGSVPAHAFRRRRSISVNGLADAAAAALAAIAAEAGDAAFCGKSTRSPRGDTRTSVPPLALAGLLAA